MTKTIWIWATVFTFLLSSYNNSESAVSLDQRNIIINRDSEQRVIEGDPNLSKMKFDNINLDSPTYKIVDANYTDRNVTIKYPQITDLNDVTKQKMINEIIRDESFESLTILHRSRKRRNFRESRFRHNISY